MGDFHVRWYKNEQNNLLHITEYDPVSLTSF